MAPPQLPSPAGGSDIQRRVSNKLRKKRREEHLTMAELPERLRDSDESDAEDDSPSQGPPMFMNMNQSIFGLIAAAGSKVDYNERFDHSSSDDDDASGPGPKSGGREDLAQTTILQPIKKKDGHKRTFSGHKLLKSLPSLPKRKSKSKREPSKLSQPPEDTDETGEPSDLQTPAIKLTGEEIRLAPVMSRMLEARAEISNRPSFDLERRSSDVSHPGDLTTPLARRLMEIFEFDEPEQVIEGMCRSVCDNAI